MKFLFVLASLIVLSNALNKEFKEKFMEKVEEYGTKCIEEVHATDADLAELMAHKIPPTTHEAKCMIFCMHKAFNVVNEDGTPNKEGALKILEPLKNEDAELYEKSVKMLDICTNSFEKDSDPCVASTNYAQCGLKEGKALGLSEDLFDM